MSTPNPPEGQPQYGQQPPGQATRSPVSNPSTVSSRSTASRPSTASSRTARRRRAIPRRPRTATPPYGQYGAGPTPGTNGMAIAGFVLSFLCSILGLIFSIIGLNQTKQRPQAGGGLAIAGIIISILSIIGGIDLLRRAPPASEFGPSAVPGDRTRSRRDRFRSRRERSPRSPPMSAFDPAHRHVPLCPFHTITGWQCPLCGGLRCADALVHGQWSAPCTTTCCSLPRYPCSHGCGWTRGAARAPVALSAPCRAPASSPWSSCW